MQEIWVSGIEWDDCLPINIAEKANSCCEELEDLSKIKIQRCLREPSTAVIVEKSFHVFTDASQEAYAAVMFQRNILMNHYQFTLLLQNPNKLHLMLKLFLA